MFFSPHLKRKKGTNNNKCIVKPFPNNEFGQKYVGIFSGISVEVLDEKDIIAIYDSGFYGKGSQSRSAPQILMQNPTTAEKGKNDKLIESLSLSLEEAFFLCFYLKVLKIFDSNSKEINQQCYFDGCLKANQLFAETLASYLYLKAKGWVVKSGLKFGGNYLIYHKGPRFYHASFVVVIQISSDTAHLESKNLKGLQRIAETSDKDVLILEVHKPDNFQFINLESISNVKISEMIIRRFNCSSYVQNYKTVKLIS